FLENYRWVKGIIRNPNDPNDFSNLELATVDEFLQERKDVITDFNWPAFKERLDEMNHKNESGSRSGDIIIVMDGREGYQSVFITDDSFPGWHGGPTVSESHVPLMFSMPGNLFISEGLSETRIPTQLANGFASGLLATDIKESGYLRNWHMSPLLQGILQEFR
ncbi:MAG: hypothetical protein COB61_009520, partial [Thiotrichales bacterium]|nr:hypothetical protein [Thiotrichales bacterium]